MRSSWLREPRRFATAFRMAAAIEEATTAVAIITTINKSRPTKAAYAVIAPCMIADSSALVPPSPAVATSQRAARDREARIAK